MVWNIEDEEADNDTTQGRPEVTAVEKFQIQTIQHVPDPTPDQNQSNHDGEVLGEIPQGQMFISFHNHNNTLIRLKKEPGRVLARRGFEFSFGQLN